MNLNGSEKKQKIRKNRNKVYGVMSSIKVVKKFQRMANEMSEAMAVMRY